jgi:hypothetical protein
MPSPAYTLAHVFLPNLAFMELIIPTKVSKK